MDNYSLYKNMWCYSGAPHKEMRLSHKQMSEMLNGGGWIVRNCYDFDCAEETGFWQIVKSNIPTEEELGKQTRKNLRKSLSVYDYRLISKDEFLEKGYLVYKEAMMRYGYTDSCILSEQQFVSGYKDLDTSKYDIWGGFDIETGEMAMWETVRIFGDCVEMKSEKLSFRFTKHNPTYGLNYRICEYYLRDRGMKYVCAGWRSLTEHSNVQNFLIDKFKFRKAYCHVSIRYVWYIKLIVAILFPFRKLIHKPNVTAFLRLEAIRRGYNN